MNNVTKKREVAGINRIKGIDLTKGILVVFMAIYHGLNYFDRGSGRHFYLAFVPPSFIIVTGFIVSQVYTRKYGNGLIRLGARLWGRSLKILLIFTALNIVIRIAFSQSAYGVGFDLDEYLRNWVNIYVEGNPRMAIFDILLPIAYVLFLSVLSVWLESVMKYVGSFTAISLSLLCVVLELSGRSIYNVNLIGAGFVGIALGSLPLQQINRFLLLQMNFLLLPLLYVLLMMFSPDAFYSQLFLTVVCLMIIYGASIRANTETWVSREIMRIGKYSLLAYITQVGCLYTLLKVLARFEIGSVIPVTAAVVISWTISFLSDYFRSKFRLMDRIYTLVFS